MVTSPSPRRRKVGSPKEKEKNQQNSHLLIENLADCWAMPAFTDPLFFLHHTQLDRLWWKWQQVDVKNRLRDYSGRAVFNSTEGRAGLDDVLWFGDLGPSVKVSDIMDTRGGLLCYMY